uniref:Putative type 1 membrane protein n=1 Tax=Populus tomentosa TaxID=118781 RepID=A0A1I9VZX8_POPTO|nr:putative type 1 membrane protein [Populus tomentosa]
MKFRCVLSPFLIPQISPSLSLDKWISKYAAILHLFVIFSLFFSLAEAETAGSVFFIDSQTRQYLRTPSPNDGVQSMSLQEVGAAVSVLLGFAPSDALSAASSSKLNEVLMPTPFNRPRAVFMLEVTGEIPSMAEQANAMFNGAFKSKIVLGSDKAGIQLPGEEVSVVSLDEELADFTDKEISDFASWLGGSYVVDPLEAWNGELAIPLASGATTSFHMSKKANREFITSLLALFRNSRRAVEMHEDLSQSTQPPAELLKGGFDGLKALGKQYGPEGAAQKGLELLLTTLSKMFDSLQTAYKGQIAGVIFFNAAPASESETMLDIMLTSQPSARWLEETKTPSIGTIAEVALVRLTLAWITGIVLHCYSFGDLLSPQYANHKGHPSLLQRCFSESDACFIGGISSLIKGQGLQENLLVDANSFHREESLWLREEQRWLREEERWLREEKRWSRDRESLLAEIQSLKLQIEALENRISVLQGGEDTVAKVGLLLQVLKDKNNNSLIAESGSSARPLVLEENVVEEQKEVIGRVLEEKKEKERKTLRKGSEGEQVKEMQDALQKLGFYSGEEDMEYSSFSSGTERAVKTWQASLGASEDGIMTTELLKRLYMEQHIDAPISSISETQKGSAQTVPAEEGADGAAVTSVTEIPEIHQKVVKEEVTEVEVSHHRVFLLGENRWEEPSRLNGRKKQVSGSKTKDSSKQCLTCRGEGRLLCTECDGTGEPNVEPQFLEWVDEGANCPYCEGQGYTICDVCEGKTTI